jgi:hypothetical protein
MKIVNTLTVMALTSVMAGAPAFAEGREPVHRRAEGERSAHAAAVAPHAVAVAPRAVAVAPHAVAVAPRAAAVAPHAVVVAPSVVVGHAVPRPYAPYHAHAVAVAPITFYHPYYTFRPHVHVGFGLWVGYPVVYSAPYYVPVYAPYAYAYPYPYPYPPAPYPYPPAAYPPYPQTNPGPPPPYPPPAAPPTSYPSPSATGTVSVQANMGGLSFQITPQSADVFIDGGFVGTVGQFTPESQPLGVPAGHHRVEIRSQGFRTIAFDANIVAGQVLPYQGSMDRS